MKIALIACSSAKRDCSAPAQKLYQGALFQKSWMYGSETCDEIGVLSAKYGLLLPEQVVAPYDQSLNSMNGEERFAWASRTFKQLRQQWPLYREPVELVFLAGQSYRRNLVKILMGLNEGELKNEVRISVPMEGMSIGKQLQWLGQQIHQLNR